MADPLSTRPEDDAGAATQDRFAWQHHCIAVDCVGLIVGDQNRRVICEIQEDYVVEHNSGSLELVTCKHRDGSRGPWKLVDLCLDGGVGHLFGRWSKFADTSLRLMTNGSLATGAAEAAAVARACSQAAEGAPIHDGTDIAMCRDSLARALLAARNRKGFAGIPVVAPVSTGRAAAHRPIPADFLVQVEMFMRVLKICADLPDRRVVESHHTYQLMVPCLEKLGFDPAHAPISYRQLVELVHRKNTASPLRDAYGEYVWSRRTATASGQQAALVTVRTITADDVLRVVRTSFPRIDGSAATAAEARLLDPSKIRSRAEFATQLDALRARRQLTLRNLEDRDKARQGARHSDPTLNRRNLNDALNHHRIPSAQFVQAYLDSCGVPTPDQAVWLAAWHRTSAGQHEPTRVWDASPLELGVQGVGDGNAPSHTLPPYVPRDHDASVREALKTTGCFIVLVGPSSVGKTRTLFEAVRAVAPNWYVVRPSDADDIFRLAAEQPQQTILWLDELQRYLGGHRDLSAAVISHLITAGIMVVGTLWTTEYNALLAPRGGADDHQSQAANVLQRADIITIEQTLTLPERQRAADLAAGDDRLAQALRTTDYTFIQMLAGGPALVQWWTELSNPHALAMINAAVDARRLGVQSPFDAALLTEAMHGYLPPLDRMTDPATWPGRALTDATVLLPGAVSPVQTVDGRSAGSPTRFVLADFLVQHVSRVRRTICPPHSLWSALVGHLVETSDIRRVAASARARMRYRYSEPLLRQLIAAGEGSAAIEMADILFSHDRLDDAVALLQSHLEKYPHEEAVRVHLAHLCVLQCRITELRHAATTAKRQTLAEIFADRGWTEALRLRADAGDPAAQDDLAQLLADRGEIGELETRARAGDTFAADRRAALYATQGRLDQLRALASLGDEPGSFHLARLLARQGQVSELAQRSANGDRFALDRLTTLASPSSSSTPQADSGDPDPAMVARLRSELGTSTPQVYDQLTRVLLEGRLVPALWEEMNAGTPQAAERLTSLLMTQEAIPGHLLVRLRTYGLNADGSVADPEDWA